LTGPAAIDDRRSMEPGHVMNQQTQPAVSFIELTHVVAGAAYAVGASPSAT
jgi:hypothetical protein